MTRSAKELRAEIAHWKQRQREASSARQPMESLAAAIIVQTLAYAVCDVAGPTTRMQL